MGLLLADDGGCRCVVIADGNGDMAEANRPPQRAFACASSAGAACGVPPVVASFCATPLLRLCCVIA